MDALAHKLLTLTAESAARRALLQAACEWLQANTPDSRAARTAIEARAEALMAQVEAMPVAVDGADRLRSMAAERLHSELAAAWPQPPRSPG